LTVQNNVVKSGIQPYLGVVAGGRDGGGAQVVAPAAELPAEEHGPRAVTIQVAFESAKA
jgi:hypothetical protein